MNKSGATYAQIARAAKIPPVITLKDGAEKKDAGKHVQNLHDQFNSRYVARIRRFMESQIKEGFFDDAPPVTHDLINCMRGKPQISHNFADEIFNPMIEEGDRWKRRIYAVYGGTWLIVRFAAHSTPAMQAPRKDEEGNEDPWMIYAIMQVELTSAKLDNDLPSFTILYSPHDDQESGVPWSIHGNIISLREGPYMQFIGREEGTQYPVVIAANQIKNEQMRPKRFTGLVLRKVEGRSFIVGRAAFVRAEQPWDVVCADKTLGKVGALTRSELIRALEPHVPDIRSVIEGVRNTIEHGGCCALHLQE
jgi:hypothetical protein